MAEWAYLWLQKRHLHGIDHAEAIRYLLEGAAAKSANITKLRLLEIELSKVKVDAGELNAGPAPTLGNPDREIINEAQLQLRRQVSESVAADKNLTKLYHAEEKYLEAAIQIAIEHKKLVDEIYEIDEEIEGLSKGNNSKSAELVSSILSLQKKIQEIECPRDDSLDNSVIVWCSQAFASGDSGAGTATTGESSVPTVCSILEDTGFTVRRSSDPEEAIQRARELQQEGQLRCVIIGGDEKGASCGPSCVKQHTGLCVRCNEDAVLHSGHECPSGGRGSWLLDINKSSVKGAKIASNYLDTLTKLIDKDSLYARSHSPLPPERMAIYSAHVTMSEKERMSFWNMDAVVFDGPKPLVAWAQAMNAWTSPSAAEEDSKDTQIIPNEGKHNEISDEKLKMAQLKAELDALENQKIALGDTDESARKHLQQMASDKHAQLDASVAAAINNLSIASDDFSAIVGKIASTGQDVSLIKRLSLSVGPGSGRDAALALAWLEINKSTIDSQISEGVNKEFALLINRHWSSVINELNFLKQMALAAKVVAHVTMPHHKKLLNLCYNWLR